MSLPSVTSFKDLPLSAALAKSIEELGFTTPSPVQAQALPILLGDPTDFVGLAATGTGKTAAFSIPLLERIDVFTRSVQAIVLCPTRELAIQVAGQIELLGKHQGVKAAAIYGGAGYGDQIAALRRGAQIVVGTPGRVVDHLERGTLDLGLVQVVVLDEADEMISMGFKDDLEAILGCVPGLALGEDASGPRTSNIWLFSATMSREVRGISEDYLDGPAHVEINRTEMLPENLEQIYYATSEGNKPEVLCKLIDAAEDFYGIVFCQTKALVVDLVQYLVSRGYAVDALHGDMDQKARERTMKNYRERRVKILVCTDVASRGIDVKDITHVINYSIPRELDSYVHRIGRTARSGKKGYAMSLVTHSHRGLLGRIERMTKSRIHEGKIPTRKEIGLKKIGALLEKLEAAPGAERATDLISAEAKAKLAAMDPTELAAKFLALMMPEVFVERAEPEAAAQPAGRMPGPKSHGSNYGGAKSYGKNYVAPRGAGPITAIGANSPTTGTINLSGGDGAENGQVQIRSVGLSSESVASERAEEGYHARKQSKFGRKDAGGGFGRRGFPGDRRSDSFGGERRSDSFGGERRYGRRDERSESSERRAYGRQDYHAEPRGAYGTRPAARRWGQPAGGETAAYGERKPRTFGGPRAEGAPAGKSFGKPFKKPFAKASGKVFAKPYPTRAKGPVGLT